MAGFCTVCGWKYEGDPKFCQQCGTPMGANATAGSTAAAPAAAAADPDAGTAAVAAGPQTWTSEEHELWTGRTMDMVTQGQMSPNHYRLTSRAIYYSHGRIGSTEHSIPLWAVGSVTLEQDMVDKMRNVGNLTLEIEHPKWTDETKQVRLELIENPQEVRDLIQKQVREEQYNFERRDQTMFYQGRPPYPTR